MPNALQLDWNMIRECYTNGMPLKEIASQFGVQPSTISCRASRAGWKSIATKAKAMVQAVTVQVQENQEDSPALSKQSQRVRSGLAGVLERSIDRLEQLSFKTPKAALKANQELESVVRNAKTVFGWSDSTQSPAVRISIMDSTVLLSDQGKAIEQDNVIDVTSEPLPLPPPEQG